jgi:hypothetical protein
MRGSEGGSVMAEVRNSFKKYRSERLFTLNRGEMKQTIYRIPKMTRNKQIRRYQTRFIHIVF